MTSWELAWTLFCVNLLDVELFLTSSSGMIKFPRRFQEYTMESCRSIRFRRSQSYTLFEMLVEDAKPGNGGQNTQAESDSVW